MLLTIHSEPRRGRLVVFAYDIASPKRARRVRKVLDSIHHAKQYSVFEVMLGEGAFKGVLAEITTLCDMSEDKLMTCWPRDGLRLRWAGDRLVVGARAGQPCREPAVLAENTGNFILCYDVSDPDALRAIAALVAPETVMLQRSVYWLRAPATRLCSLLSRCAHYLEETDRLWAYPLSGSHALWFAGEGIGSILPISTSRWGQA